MAAWKKKMEIETFYILQAIRLNVSCKNSARHKEPRQHQICETFALSEDQNISFPSSEKPLWMIRQTLSEITV